MGTEKQVEYITRICNQQLYLLNQIRKQVLPQAQLHKVFQAIILCCIQYASPAWYGYPSEVHNRLRIQNMLVKAKR